MVQSKPKVETLKVYFRSISTSCLNECIFNKYLWRGFNIKAFVTSLWLLRVQWGTGQEGTLLSHSSTIITISSLWVIALWRIVTSIAAINSCLRFTMHLRAHVQSVNFVTALESPQRMIQRSAGGLFARVSAPRHWFDHYSSLTFSMMDCRWRCSRDRMTRLARVFYVDRYIRSTAEPEWYFVCWSFFSMYQ